MIVKKFISKFIKKFKDQMTVLNSKSPSINSLNFANLAKHLAEKFCHIAKVKKSYTVLSWGDFFLLSKNVNVSGLFSFNPIFRLWMSFSSSYYRYFFVLRSITNTFAQPIDFKRYWLKFFAWSSDYIEKSWRDPG